MSGRWKEGESLNESSEGEWDQVWNTLQCSGVLDCVYEQSNRWIDGWMAANKQSTKRLNLWVDGSARNGNGISCRMVSNLTRELDEMRATTLMMRTTDNRRLTLRWFEWRHSETANALNEVLLLLQTHGHYTGHSAVTLITAPARLRVDIITTRRKDGQWSG